ncbi:MAG TPA: peptidoglycan-associated lipoprotein Pal [Burkholderiaceae bacterium]|nr:peptidoglycan-associated lipoprotein Pal [Burkholderiaceae bacterium]
MKHLRVALLAVAIAYAASGCSSTSLEQKPAPITTPETRPTPAPGSTPTTQPGPTPVEQAPAPAAGAIDELNNPKSLLARRSVYFEFDSSSIKDSDVPVIEAHGRYLVDHPKRTVRIEGSCDERGGREYNLALGQRRAEAVRERLKVLGVPSNRIETISLGKEKPRNPGHDEAAWAENRRADIIYQ